MHPSTTTTPTAPSVQMPAVLVEEVRDSLLGVVHDLQRLDDLLSHTMGNLMERFTDASSDLSASSVSQIQDLSHAREALKGAVTELQFHDLASQLIAHTSNILQVCVCRLASQNGGEGLGSVAAVAAVALANDERTHPVTQGQMSAGSVELF